MIKCKIEMSQVLEVDDRKWLLFLSVTNNSLTGEYLLIKYVCVVKLERYAGNV